MRLILLIVCLGTLAAETTLARFPGDDFAAASVALEFALVDRKGAEADVLVTFMPVVPPGGEPLHLYSKDLPPTGIDGVGRPTQVRIPPGEPLRPLGEAVLDPPLPVHEVAGLPVYPDGPVRLRLPVQLPAGDGAPVPVQVLVTYMSCTANSCNRPVTDRALTIPVPSDPDGWSGEDQPQTSSNDSMPADWGTLRELINEAVTSALREQAITDVAWRHASDPAQVEDLIAAAHARDEAVLLDFTGPSCANCQLMKKTVFQDPRVIAAWNAAVPVEVNTDASVELALWQRERFETEARPLYVRLDPDGSVSKWSLVFSLNDEATMQQFLGFLSGAAGIDGGTGTSWWQFVALALGGGLFTLLMPCTYPMIPLTINFFTKQASAGRHLLPLALFYGFGILACFVGLGLIVSFVIGGSVASFAGNPWTNLIIALLFLLLGLSLLGAFFLRLPAAVQNRLGGGKGGYAGALLMGLAFAVTAFTCTAPFAGAVLAEGVRSGDALRPAIGMLIYASAIAVPFVVLALAPGTLRHLPGAGSWMNEIKHVGGLVEIAAALKFLAISDAVWGWGLVGRTLSLAVWAIIAVMCGIYVLGLLRMEGDAPVSELSASRLLIALAFLALGLWFAAGLLGPLHLGVIESFFPLDAAPTVLS